MVNPFLKRLGLPPEARVLVFHADDLGMSVSGLQAFRDITQNGLTLSGSAMVPCPWFLEVVRYGLNHPQADIGIHLTFTSEWEDYRWGPVSRTDTESGLVDRWGYFHRNTHGLKDVPLKSFLDEITAQIGVAQVAGLRASHMDWHMGAILQRGDLMNGAVNLALEHGMLPIFLRGDEATWRKRHLGEQAPACAKLSRDLENEGFPLFDHNLSIPSNMVARRLEWLENVLTKQPPGLIYLPLHPCKDTPDLHVITHDAPARISDYHLLMDARLPKFLQGQGIHLRTCRQLLEAWTEGNPRRQLAAIG